MTLVLDASAVLALLRNEPGADEVERLITDEGGMITTVNVVEVLRRLRRDGHDARACEQALHALPIFAVPYSHEMSLRSSRIDDPDGVPALALGDRACIGAAIELGATIVTADRAWQLLDVPVDVRQVR